MLYDRAARQARLPRRERGGTRPLCATRLHPCPSPAGQPQPDTRTRARASALGHPCPHHVNPAEFLIDLVSVDHDSPAAAAADEARIDALARAWRRREGGGRQAEGGGRQAEGGGPRPRHRATAAEGGGAGAGGAAPERRRRPRLLRRLALLLRRSWRQNWRDRWVNGLRLCVSGGLALVFGEIFGRFGAPSAAQIAERVALLSYASINMSMMAMMKARDLFGRERRVEPSRNLLGTF